MQTVSLRNCQSRAVTATLFLQTLFCVFLQTYIINQAKVMFLNQRPQSKISKPGAPDACHTCARTLREGCSYCSLACKLESLTGCGKPHMGSSFAAAAAAGSSGAESDCASDCWPAAVVAARAAHMQQHKGELAGSDGAATATDGDSSDSDQMRQASWGGQHAQHLQVGAAAAQLMRRNSDSDSEGRMSSGSYCSRRKQVSPRRSPLL
jgi:hypothetical protein